MAEYKKLLRRDLKAAAVIYQATDNLYYKGGDKDSKKYILLEPAIIPRNYTSFIPECKADNDVWDDNLEIVGADCDVWITEKWWVQNPRGETLIRDIHAYLCKWSTAVKKFSRLIKTIDLEEEGHFDIINKD